MIRFNVTMTPKDPAARVRAMKSSIEERRDLMRQTKRYMIDRWNQNFAGQGSIYGSWPANSSWKEPGGTLQGNTGALEGYFHAANEAGDVSDTAVHWHFENDGSQYSATHSTSGVNPNPLAGHAPVPQRIIWDTNDEDREQITLMAQRWIESKIMF